MPDNNNNIFDWIKTPPKEKSYRSIFKWGDPVFFKHPNNGLCGLLKKEFALSDDDFKRKVNLGNDKVKCDIEIKLNSDQINYITKIVGKNNISNNDYDRVKYATGKTMEEALKLRENIVDVAADLVVHPKNKDDIENIVHYCNKQKIPIYIYGGGSSVNLGFMCSSGGIVLVMSTHMNRVLEFNEINQTITVEAGMMGPVYEQILNNAPEKFNAKQKYTCGHFPQSFEYSSVGGWISALGSGQQSSYYGDAYDIVISQEYVTPAGTFKTQEFPQTATGPKVNDIMKGSEGVFGVLVSITMKIFKLMPKNTQRFAFMFPTWKSAIDASREITQAEFGMPSVFRISDPEETAIAMKMYGLEGSFIDKLIAFKGLKPGSRCLYIGQSDGEKDFALNVKKKVKKIAKNYKAMYLTGYPLNKWEHGRYTDPYLREDLNDLGIIIDTLETSVNWDNILNVYSTVRNFIKTRRKTICMTHASHFYPQGTNLYFIFIAKMKNIDEYKSFQKKIIDKIQKSGGSLSHHHGVGKMIAPWMEGHLGIDQMNILRALKKHFDPNNIMNPGGTLGL